MTRRARAGAVASATVIAACVFALIGGSGAAGAEDLNPAIKPDAVIDVGETAVIKNDDVLMGALLSYGPEACRGNPSTADDQIAPATCRVYRVQLNRDLSPKAVNTVFFVVEFDQLQVQSLPIIAAGLNPPPLNGYNIYVYDKADHWLGQDAPDPTLEPLIGPGDPEDKDPGGRSFASPELGSFVAKTDTYDFVVQSAQGVGQGFTLKIKLSNELFASPLEILDEFGKPKEALGDTRPASPFVGGLAPAIAEPLPALDVAPDDAIAGIGLGTTEQFDAAEAMRLGRDAIRNISVETDPPSTMALLLGMLLLPLTAGVAVVLLLRKRSRVLIA